MDRLRPSRPKPSRSSQRPLVPTAAPPAWRVSSSTTDAFESFKAVTAGGTFRTFSLRPLARGTCPRSRSETAPSKSAPPTMVPSRPATSRSSRPSSYPRTTKPIASRPRRPASDFGPCGHAAATTSATTPCNSAAPWRKSWSSPRSPSGCRDRSAPLIPAGYLRAAFAGSSSGMWPIWDMRLACSTCSGVMFCAVSTIWRPSAGTSGISSSRSACMRCLRAMAFSR